MNSKFPVLSMVSMGLKIVGWVTLFAAVVLVFNIGREESYGVMALAAFGVGLSVVAFGEIIGVLFAIELNTRSNTANSYEILARAAAANASVKEIERNECAECGAEYDPGDYSATVSVWLCSACKAEL